MSYSSPFERLATCFSNTLVNSSPFRAVCPPLFSSGLLAACQVLSPLSTELLRVSQTLESLFEQCASCFSNMPLSSGFLLLCLKYSSPFRAACSMFLTHSNPCFSNTVVFCDRGASCLSNTLLERSVRSLFFRHCSLFRAVCSLFLQNLVPFERLATCLSNTLVPYERYAPCRCRGCCSPFLKYSSPCRGTCVAPCFSNTHIMSSAST